MRTLTILESDMVATTILCEWEMNVPTEDRDIDDMLSVVRELTGKDYQVVVRRNEDRRLFSKNRVWYDWQLYVQVGGMLPWQVILCANTRHSIFAYLCGIINGYAAVKGGDK